MQAEFDPDRPRRIVRMASKLVKCAEAKDWLWCDERGTWETRVAELLESTALLVKEKDLTPKQVDKEIAEQVAYVALTAVLEVSKEELERATAAGRRRRKGGRSR